MAALRSRWWLTGRGVVSCSAHGDDAPVVAAVVWFPDAELPRQRARAEVFDEGPDPGQLGPSHGDGVLALDDVDPLEAHRLEGPADRALLGADLRLQRDHPA